jgi:hypothetical protein
MQHDGNEKFLQQQQGGGIYLIGGVHFVKLVNAANALVGQHQGTLQDIILRIWRTMVTSILKIMIAFTIHVMRIGQDCIYIQVVKMIMYCTASMQNSPVSGSRAIDAVRPE